MEAANKSRGEVEITIKGEKFILAPTFKAIVTMESALSLGIADIGVRFTQGRAGITDMAWVVFAGAKAGGSKMKMDDIGNLIQRHGFIKIITEVIDYLGECIGGEDPIKPVKDEGDKKPEPDSDGDTPKGN